MFGFVIIDIWDFFVGDRSLRQMLNIVECFFVDFIFGSFFLVIVLDFCIFWDVKEDDDVYKFWFDMLGFSKEEVRFFLIFCKVCIFYF